MAKRKKKPEYSVDPARMTVVVAGFGGVCGLCAAEMIYDALQNSGPADIVWLPVWRAHMGSVCVGAITFVVSLFFLEELARNSRILAWRSSCGWLPFIALTALATAIHIPACVIVVVGAFCCFWAYRRTRSVHRLLSFTGVEETCSIPPYRRSEKGAQTYQAALGFHQFIFGTKRHIYPIFIRLLKRGWLQHSAM